MKKKKYQKMYKQDKIEELKMIRGIQKGKIIELLEKSIRRIKKLK